MSNYCPNIEMPPARKDSERRPYDAPIRAESIIDLNFKRTREQKIRGLIGLAISYNALGKNFILKQEFKYAAQALENAGVKFSVEGYTKPQQSEMCA